MINDNKGINVKRGLKAKAELGIYPAPAPTGYINNKYAERGNKTVEEDPERFDTFQKMLLLVVSQKYTPMQALKFATDEWKFRTKEGKKLARSTWYRLLTNPVYAETFEYPVGSGNWYKAAHKPMITDEQFDFLQVILGRKGKPKPKTHLFAFTGLMRCGECGGTVTAEEKWQIICFECKTKFHKGKTTNECPNCHALIENMKKAKILYYCYYHCTKRVNPHCKQKSIDEETLETDIKKTIGDIKIPPEFHDWGLRQVKRVNQSETEFTERILARQQKAYNECLAQISELIDMRAAKEISPEEFLEKKPKLEKEKVKLKKLLDAVDDRATKWHKKADELFDFARDARDKFNNGGLEGKREVLSRLGSNLILEGKKLTINLEETLIPMVEAAKEVNAIHERLEPIKEADRTAQLEAAYSQSPILLRD